MFKIIIVAFAVIACVAAKPGLLVPPVAALPYANAPLYAAGGSHQVDIRHNYDGTLSSYATAPFGYTGPVASRYVAAGLAAPHFAAPLTAATIPVPAAPFAHPFAAPLIAAPLRAPIPAPVLV